MASDAEEEAPAALAGQQEAPVAIAGQQEAPAAIAGQQEAPAALAAPAPSKQQNWKKVLLGKYIRVRVGDEYVEGRVDAVYLKKVDLRLDNNVRTIPLTDTMEWTLKEEVVTVLRRPVEQDGRADGQGEAKGSLKRVSSRLALPEVDSSSQATAKRRRKHEAAPSASDAVPITRPTRSQSAAASADKGIEGEGEEETAIQGKGEKGKGEKGASGGKSAPGPKAITDTKGHASMGDKDVEGRGAKRDRTVPPIAGGKCGENMPPPNGNGNESGGKAEALASGGGGGGGGTGMRKAVAFAAKTAEKGAEGKNPAKTERPAAGHRQSRRHRAPSVPRIPCLRADDQWTPPRVKATEDVGPLLDRLCRIHGAVVLTGALSDDLRSLMDTHVKGPTLPTTCQSGQKIRAYDRGIFDRSRVLRTKTDFTADEKEIGRRLIEELGQWGVNVCTPTFIASLEKGCLQNPHIDMPIQGGSAHAGIVALMPNTYVYFYHKYDDGIGGVYEQVFLEPGEVLYFPGDQLHNGGGFRLFNGRWHFYTIDPPEDLRQRFVYPEDVVLDRATFNTGPGT